MKTILQPLHIRVDDVRIYVFCAVALYSLWPIALSEFHFGG